MTQFTINNQVLIENELCEEQYSDEYYQAQAYYQQQNQPKQQPTFIPTYQPTFQPSFQPNYQTNQYAIQECPQEQNEKQNNYLDYHQIAEKRNNTKFKRFKRYCKPKCLRCLEGIGNCIIFCLVFLCKLILTSLFKQNRNRQ